MLFVCYGPAKSYFDVCVNHKILLFVTVLIPVHTVIALTTILVQYSDKFMHSIVKFLIVLLHSLLLCFCTELRSEYSTMPCINLSEYWTTLLTTQPFPSELCPVKCRCPMQASDLSPTKKSCKKPSGSRKTSRKVCLIKLAEK